MMESQRSEEVKKYFPGNIEEGKKKRFPSDHTIVLKVCHDVSPTWGAEALD
jgi:hypothetical protein